MSDQTFVIIILLGFILIIVMQLLKGKHYEKEIDEKLKDKRSFISRIIQFNLALDEMNNEGKYNLFEIKEKRIQKEEEYYNISEELSIEISKDTNNKKKIDSDTEILLKIPGVGEILAGRLIQVFESVDQMKKLEAKVFQSIPSVGEQLAIKIAEFLDRENI